MFGKKVLSAKTGRPRPKVVAYLDDSTAPLPSLRSRAEDAAPAVTQFSDLDQEERFRELKRTSFARLVEVLDPAEILRMNVEQGRMHLSRLLNDIVLIERIQLTAEEERRLLNEISDDMLGYGPLERFLTEPDISDIMVNGTEPIYIERKGRLIRTTVRFDDAGQLLNVCQRIVSLVGRRVDEASPICDARLQDGSRVNVIIPPVAIDGAVLTIRRFQKERMTLGQLVSNGAMPETGADLLKIIARTRCNVLVVGGTGSGKTTLLNVLTAYIGDNERIVTCEDAAELQLAQPHVVRLETRASNIEGRGEVSMRDLVRNALRMRPDRIIVGEVRGPEAFDLIQAMNTGHDGSMGTLHANSPEEALSRMISLITMGYPSLQTEVIEQMIATSIDVIVQVERMRDGSRKLTNICEINGDAYGNISLRPIMSYEMRASEDGEDNIDTVNGRHWLVNAPIGQMKGRAPYFGEGERLETVLRELAEHQSNVENPNWLGANE